MIQANMQTLNLIVFVAVVACCSGCATILSEKNYPVTIDNRGGQTYFSVRDHKNQLIHEGITPQQLRLDAKAYPFVPAKYQVTFVGSDQNVQQRQLKAGVDPWLAGNILVGGVIGLGVDGATGAMYKLPKEVMGDIPAQYALTDIGLGSQIAASRIAVQDPLSNGPLRAVEQAAYEP
jgi:hypothetical protein